MGTLCKRMPRHQPSFDSLEARSLLSGEPFGVGPFMHFAASGAIRVGSTLGPDGVSSGSQEIDYRGGFWSNPVSGPQWSSTEIAVAPQWSAAVDGGHELQGALPGINPGAHADASDHAGFTPAYADAFDHGGFTPPSAPIFSLQPNVAYPDQPGGEFPGPGFFLYLTHDDDAPDFGYSTNPGPVPSFASTIAFARAKPQTTESDSSDLLDPQNAGVLSAGPQPEAQAAPVTSGKGIESAPGGVASPLIPTAFSLVPVRLSSLISSDVVSVTVPAAANAGAITVGGARAVSAGALAQFGAGRGGSPGALAALRARAWIGRISRPAMSLADYPARSGPI